MSDTTTASDPLERVGEILHTLSDGIGSPFCSATYRVAWLIQIAETRVSLAAEERDLDGLPAREGELEFLRGLAAELDRTRNEVVEASNILYRLQHPERATTGGAR